MKKLVLLTVASALLMTGCGQKNEKIAKTDTVLNVAVLSGDDKYAYSSEGDLKGIEPKLAKLVAETANLELNLITADNEEKLYSGVKDGSLDLAFGRLSETRDELKNFTVSRSYGKSGIYFLTKKYDYTDSLALYQAGNIGVMNTVKPQIDEIAGIDKFTVDDYTVGGDLGRDIISGEIDIGLVNEREALSTIKNSEDFQVQEVLNGPMEYYVAIMKNDEEFKKTVDSAIAAYYDSMLNKDIDTEDNTEEEQE
jgi:membrane-bound lytic murein transglycosylase MltF